MILLPPYLLSFVGIFYFYIISYLYCTFIILLKGLANYCSVWYVCLCLFVCALCMLLNNVSCEQLCLFVTSVQAFKYTPSSEVWIETKKKRTEKKSGFETWPNLPVRFRVPSTSGTQHSLCFFIRNNILDFRGNKVETHMNL